MTDTESDPTISVEIGLARVAPVAGIGALFGGALLALLTPADLHENPMLGFAAMFFTVGAGWWGVMVAAAIRKQPVLQLRDEEITYLAPFRRRLPLSEVTGAEWLAARRFVVLQTRRGKVRVSAATFRRKLDGERFVRCVNEAIDRRKAAVGSGAPLCVEPGAPT